ncbi:EcsC family protein, partial [bacterium]
LGGVKAVEGDTMDSAYWTSRLAFTDLIRHAARDLGKGTAPFLVRFLTQVAARFEIVVSQKVLAEIVPVVGAIGGGFINAAFTDHFNSAARYHFGLRALEKKFGEEAVKMAYRENGPA